MQFLGKSNSTPSRNACVICLYQQKVHKIPAALHFCLDAECLTPTRWDDCMCFIYFFWRVVHIWNIKVIFAYMQISAGKLLSAWHRISDLIFSACRCLARLARSLLQSCFISLLGIWNMWFPPSHLLCSLMLFSLCPCAWFINSCHSVAQITEVSRFPGAHQKVFFF